MIEFLKNWCEGIIVAVILSMIIESILPEGNHKKYVKVVIGIYIIFTILNPFLGKLDSNIKFSDQLNLPALETETIDTANIQKMYANGIEETLKNTIQEQFEYTVKKIEITYDEAYETIEEINLQLETTAVSQIEKVEIGNNIQTEKNSKDYIDIKNYISENYDLDKNKIFIN